MIRFEETEIRNSAKEILESLEHWSRCIINDKFAEKYGSVYFDYTFDNGENLIKSEIQKNVSDRMAENPGRFPIKIDAILMEDIAYFLCKDSFNNELFKEILEEDFSGQGEVRNRLTVLKDISLYAKPGQKIACCFHHHFPFSERVLQISQTKRKAPDLRFLSNQVPYRLYRYSVWDYISFSQIS